MTANAQLGAYTVTAQLIENPALSGTFSLRNIAWYVSPSGNDANSCSSPAQPCAHINQAIGKAQAGDVILVAGGEYFVNLADVDRTQVIKIDKSITLVGGWNSSFTAQNGISIVNGEAARRGVNITAGTAKLNRFLIKNGMTGAYGGGVYAAGNASLALMNSTVQSSKADYGGGVYASQLTLENSTISNNVASSHGGGAYTNGLLLGNNNTIAFNSAWMGGGLYVQGNASVKNSILANNTSGHVGADCYGNVSTEGYNLIGSTSGCTVQAAAGDQFNVDPQFAISFTTPQGVLPSKPPARQ